MSDRWVSVEEIAEYLGVSKDTVYGWIGVKDMPAHKVGRLWKFKTHEVDAWVRIGKASDKGGAVNPTSEGSTNRARIRGRNDE
jgi:excisionase family DNA binding protein